MLIDYHSMDTWLTTDLTEFALPNKVYRLWNMMQAVIWTAYNTANNTTRPCTLQEAISWTDFALACRMYCATVPLLTICISDHINSHSVGISCFAFCFVLSFLTFITKAFCIKVGCGALNEVKRNLEKCWRTVQAKWHDIMVTSEVHRSKISNVFFPHIFFCCQSCVSY